MQFQVIRGVAAAAAALGLGMAAQAATIADGGFETPVVPLANFQTFAGGSALGDWTVVGGDVYLVNQLYHGGSFAAQEGEQWLSLSATMGSGVQQTFATDPGGLYTLSFWAGSAVDAGGGGVDSDDTLKVMIGANTYDFANLPGPTCGTTIRSRSPAPGRRRP
jgi:hypothetical protein